MQTLSYLVAGPHIPLKTRKTQTDTKITRALDRALYFQKSTLDIVLGSGGSTNPVCCLLGQKITTIYSIFDILDDHKRAVLLHVCPLAPMYTQVFSTPILNKYLLSHLFSGIWDPVIIPKEDCTSMLSDQDTI